MMPRTVTPCALGVSGETLSALRDGLLGAEETRRLREHIAGCVACQTRLAAFEETQRALAAQRLPDIQDQVWRGLRGRMDGGRGRQEMRLRTPVIGGLAAVAAVILVALFAALLLSAHSPAPAHGTPTASQSATATGATTPTDTATRASNSTGFVPVNLPGNACTRSFLAASPADPQTLYGCRLDQTQRVELIVSHDGGAHWSSPLATPVTEAPQGDAALAVNPTNARDLLLAAEINQGANLVYRSFDGGAHWQHLTNLGGLTFEALGWAGSTAFVQTVLTESGGGPQSQLYMSRNGGAFVRVDHDGTIAGYDLSQSPLLFGSIQGSMLFLTFGQVVSPIATTLVSADGGGTWAQSAYTDSHGQQVDPLGVGPTGHALVGVYRNQPRTVVYSTNAGVSWNSAPSLPANVVDLTQVLISDDGVIFVSPGSASSDNEIEPHVYEFRPGASGWTSPVSYFGASYDYRLFAQQDAQGHPVALWTVRAGILCVYHL